jgi:hypothetical protein
MPLDTTRTSSSSRIHDLAADAAKLDRALYSEVATAIPYGLEPTPKGDPATFVRAPLDALILKAETLLDPEFVT